MALAALQQPERFGGYVLVLWHGAGLLSTIQYFITSSSHADFYNPPGLESRSRCLTVRNAAYGHMRHFGPPEGGLLLYPKGPSEYAIDFSLIVNSIGV